MLASLDCTLKHVHDLARSTNTAAMSDRDLLRAFSERRDELAFAELVHRHGSLVYGTCRRLLVDVHTADDVFQATFLALARHARRAWQPTIGPWLYKVAYRLAQKAHSRTAARTNHPCNKAIEDDPFERMSARELLVSLEEEIAGLPARLRDAVVLCYLEGETGDAAARKLGYSLRTLKRRLERGRKLLRSRLAKRGIVPALFAAALVPARLQAAVPTALARNATIAAVRDAIGESVPESVLALLPATGWAASRLARLVTMGLLILGAVTAGLFTSGGANPPIAAEPPAAKPAEAAPTTDPLGDPLPPNATMRIGTMRYRHGCGMNNAALSADGKLLATANESQVIIWDLASGKPLHILRGSSPPNGFSQNLSLMSFSTDGRTLATVVGDDAQLRSVRLWDVATGKKTVQNYGGANNWLQFVPGGKELAIGGAGAILLRDPAKEGDSRRIETPHIPVAFTADGKMLLVISKTVVELWDTATAKERLKIETKGTESAAVSSDGKLIATGAGDGNLHLWDGASGKELWVSEAKMEGGHDGQGPISTMVFSRDAKQLFAGIKDGRIRRWSIATGEELAPLKGHLKNYVTGLFASPDGKQLISTGWDCVIRRWEIDSGKEIPATNGYAAYLHVAHSPDGKLAAVSDYTGKIELRDLATGKLHRAIAAAGMHCSRLLFSPDGKHLVGGSGNSAIVVWDSATGREVRRLIPEGVKADTRDWFEGLCFSPDGSQLATCSRNGGTRKWEFATGKETLRISGNGCVVISPDGKTLVIGGWDHDLKFFDAATGASLRKLPVHNTTDNVTYSPDGTLMATSHHGGAICLRDPKSGVERRRIESGDDVIWNVSFSPDGEWVVGGESQRHRVRVWDVESGQELLTLSGHEGRVYQAHFLPDGASILSAADDLTALRWTVRPSDLQREQPDFDKLWTNLEDQGSTAFRAVWTLAAYPAQSVALLRKKIARIPPPLDPQKVRQLIDELDADTFARREAASKELARLGRAVQGPLQDAIKEAATPEKRRRLQALVDVFQKRTLSERRESRAVLALTLAGGEEATALLREWAGGAQGAWLAGRAKSALERLSH